MQTMKCIVEAFHAALLTVSDPEESKNVEYKVEGSAGKFFFFFFKDKKLTILKFVDV